MNGTIHHNTRIAAFVERKMRTWGQVQETADRAAGHQEPDHVLAQAVKYVAISREAGAAGTTVARLVGERLAGRCTTRTFWIRLPSAIRNRD